MNDEFFDKDHTSRLSELTEKEVDVLVAFESFKELYELVKEEQDLSPAEIFGVMMSLIGIKFREEGMSHEEFLSFMDEVREINWNKKPKLTIVK